MTLYSNTFEGAPASGTTISTSNSGGASGTAFDVVVTGASAWCVYDDTRTKHGSYSMKLHPASGVAVNVGVTVPSTKTLAARMYLYITAAATADFYQIRFTVGGTRVLSVHIQGTGKFRVADAAGASPGLFTAAAAVPNNTFVRIELYGSVGTTTSNSTVTFASYLGDSTTPIDSFTTSTANLGTSAFTGITFGKADTSTYATEYWIDDLAWDDAASGLIGPFVSPSGPLGKIAVIGDSLTYQDGNGLTNLTSALVARGWLSTDIYFYAVTGKAIATADSNGKTTVQSVADARSALGVEPAVWLIALGTNGSNATDTDIAGFITDVLTAIGSTHKVLWPGLTRQAGANSDELRTNANLFNTLNASWPNAYSTDWNHFVHNGRDESSLWYVDGLHMVTAGYTIRNAFLADQATRLVDNLEPQFVDVKYGSSQVRAVYNSGVLMWTAGT
jgi:hypothetical protein